MAYTYSGGGGWWWQHREHSEAATVFLIVLDVQTAFFTREPDKGTPFTADLPHHSDFTRGQGIQFPSDSQRN